MSTGTVEFRVKITDDGGFKKLEISAEDLNGAVKRIKTETDKLGSGFSNLSKFAIGFNQVTELVNRVGQSLRKVIDVGSSNELQKLNLTTLFKGNAEAAEDMFARISKYGKETVYDKEGLIEAQKTMMSFGISGEQAFTTLKQIGDIAMGDSQKMQSLALAFSQATSTGKLMGQDLLQMINAGFNPLAVISEHTGESMASLKEKMSQGAISAEMLAQAFQWATEEGALFYQGAESAGNTTQGKLNELEDTFNEFLINVFNQLQPVINAVIDFSTNVLNAIPGVLETIRTAFGNIIDTISDFSGIILGVAAAVGTLTVAINASKIAMAGQELILNLLIAKEKIQIALTKAWKAAQAALNLVLKANPIGIIVTAIALLAGAIATVVKNTSGWGETWESVHNYINKSLGQMGAWFKLKWLQISDYVLSGIEEIMRAWYKLQSLWDSDAADAGLAKMQSKAEERAKAIAEQKAILEGKKEERQETTVTWAVKWERKSKKGEDNVIVPVDVDTKSLTTVENTVNETIETTKELKSAHKEVTGEVEKQQSLWEKQKDILSGVLADIPLPVQTIQQAEDAIKRLTEKKQTASYESIAAIKEEIEYYEYLKETIENGGNPLKITIEEYRKIKQDKGNEGNGVPAIEMPTAKDTFTKGWSGIKGIGNSIRDIKDALTETDNAWDALTQTVDGFLGLIQGIQAVVEVIKTITSVTKAFQVVEETATATQIAANASLSTSNTAVAATAAAASVACIPLVGPELALTWASTIEAMLSAIPKFANGGLVYGPTVGLMGEYSGARSNPEVIAPLNKLRGLLGEGGGGKSEVKFRIEGRELVGIMNKQNNIYKRSK